MVQAAPAVGLMMRIPVLIFAGLWVALGLSPTRARACSEPADGVSTLVPTSEGFVFLPLPREDYVIAVRGDRSRRIAVQLGMYADVSPDGRWLATWIQDYSDEMLGAACFATRGRLWVYDLHHPERPPRRSAWLDPPSGGLRVDRIAFRGARTIEVVAEAYGESRAHRSYRIRRDVLEEGTLHQQPMTEERSTSGNLPTEESEREHEQLAEELATHGNGLTVDHHGRVMRVSGGGSTVHFDAGDVESVVFSQDGRSLGVVFGTRDEMDPYETYTSRGFIIVRLDTGRQIHSWGVHPSTVFHGRIALRCVTRVHDPASPLVVRSVPGARSPRRGEVAHGREVSVHEVRGAWSRIAAPPGWVFSAHLRHSCVPVARDATARPIPAD